MAEPIVMPGRGQVKIRNENVLLLVAFVDGNVQIMTNRALIKRLDPRDMHQTARAIGKIVQEDFGSIIIP